MATIPLITRNQIDHINANRSAVYGTRFRDSFGNIWNANREGRLVVSPLTEEISSTSSTSTLEDRLQELRYTDYPGVVKAYAGPQAPAGYLMCDGSTYSVTAHPDLFAVTGYVYGGSEGVFAVPDLRQRFVLGKAFSGTGAALGSAGGSIDHAHTVNPPITVSASAGAHTHTIDPAAFNTSSDGSHDHGGVTGASGSTTVDSIVGLSTAAPADHTHTISSDGAHTHSVDVPSTTSSSDGAHAHEVDVAQFNSGANNPPFLALNFIIKT